MKRTFWGDTKQRRRCISFFLCLLLCLNLLSLAGCGSGNGDADSPSEAENTASYILDSTDQTDTSWRDDAGSADATRPADSGEWTCPSCGETNSGKFCSNCGTARP